MAEVTVLVCDVCKGSKEVFQVKMVRAGKNHRADLCEKCFADMSKKYGFTVARKGWSRTQVIDFEDIPRNTP